MFPDRMLCPNCKNHVVRHCSSPTCNWYPCRRDKCQLTLVAIERIPGEEAGWYARTRMRLPSP